MPVYEVWVAGATAWKWRGHTDKVFGLGLVKPDSTNTGVPAGTTLTRHDGDQVITVAGTVIDGWEIYGNLQIHAANVVVRNTKVRGQQSTATSDARLIDAVSGSCSNLLVEDCEVVADYPSLYLTGVYGHDMTVRRTHIHGTVDGFGLMTGTLSNVLEANLVEQLTYFSPDPTHADNKSHNDCIQIFSGAGHTIVGNTLHSYLSTTAGTLGSSTVAPPSGNQGLSCLLANAAGITGLVFTDNWCEGGGIPVNLTGANLTAGSNIGTFYRNKFDGNPVYTSPMQTIQIKTGLTYDAGGGTANKNTMISDGSEIVVRFL